MVEYKNRYALIMAGGVGSRFWPVSTDEFPKQFHDMLGTGDTLLQRTFKRLHKLVPFDNILVLTNERYRDLVQEQLPILQPMNIVGEPAMRNTAPCILLSVLKVYKKNPDAVMIVAPSDSWIEDEDAFVNDVTIGLKAASEENVLITLGIQPTFANTGYGYIAFAKASEEKIKPVQRFTEKPDYATAQTFLKEGNYLWNAGMFIWSAQTIVDTYESKLPEMYKLFYAGMSQINTAGEQDFISKNYEEAENVSVDYGIMERSDHVKVIPASFDWNDLGTWGSLYDKLPKNDDDNAVVGVQLFAEDSSGTVVYGPEGKAIVIDGLKDYIVVDKDNTLIIVPRSKEQDIKQIRARVLKHRP